MARADRKTKSGPAEPRLEHLRIADLIAHPDQGVYFPAPDPHTFDALVRSIRAGGVGTPLDVLPAGNAAGLPALTVLGGHTRAAAAEATGLTTVPARVRYDLLGAARGAVDEVFLEDNTLRRQLGPLARARAAVGLYRARKAKAGQTVPGDVFASPKLRDEIGRILDMSGRNLGRYLNVLNAPVEVQVALEAGRIKLTDAARVVGLPKTEQRSLAARLAAGDDPKAVFAEFFPPKGRGHVKAADAVAALARTLEAAHADLADRLGEVTRGPVSRFEGELRSGRRLIRELLRKLDPAD